jgi:hypothetical protein
MGGPFRSYTEAPKGHSCSYIKFPKGHFCSYKLVWVDCFVGGTYKPVWVDYFVGWSRPIKLLRDLQLGTSTEISDYSKANDLKMFNIQ